MEPGTAWIGFTLLAVCCQSARTAAQRQLSRRMDEVLVALVRYLFSLPLIACYFTAVRFQAGEALIVPGATFWVFIAVASVSQIIATVLMLRLFHLRNFAVGITYVRSETFLTAVVGSLFFAEALALMGWVAILVSVLGVMVLNLARQELGVSGWGLVWNKAAGLGLTAGLLFAICSLSIRTASLSLGYESYLLRGATTVFSAVIIQVIIMLAWFSWQKREIWKELLGEWKAALFIGCFSGLGSIGWFTAFSLQLASYVKALSQIELILAIGISALIFKEKIKPLEYIGVGLIATGVLFLVLI